VRSAYIFSLYSVVHGDEHQVDASAIRPTWRWLSASKQWHTAHANAYFSACAAAPLSVPTAAAGGQSDATCTLTLAHPIKASTEIKFTLEGHEAFNLPTPEVAKIFRARVAADMPAGQQLAISIKLALPKAEDQMYVTMPPGVAPGGAFRALLADGRELLVTPPEGLPPGETMLVTVPTEAVNAAKSVLLSKLGGEHGGGADGKKMSKAEMRAAAAASALARRARQNVFGISYHQIEQFIIAKYGMCANGRLMGSLAGAVRAGRMMRDGKLCDAATGSTRTLSCPPP
jgi:hypothetical protein